VIAAAPTVCDVYLCPNLNIVTVSFCRIELPPRLHSVLGYRSPQEFEPVIESTDAASISIVAKLYFAHSGSVHRAYSPS
jgi:hypothetical protein